MAGYEMVADALATAGVQCIFGLLGDDTGPLIFAATERGIRYVFVRHENQAVAMADGYSRVTGRVGVATVTGGPGFSNAITAINTAHRGGSRVCVLIGTGSVAEDELERTRIRTTPPANWLKYLPQSAMLDLLGIPTVKPAKAASAGRETRIALDQARMRTVVLMLARDVLQQTVSGEGDVSATATEAIATVRQPDPEQIATVADLLQETWAVNRPLILAGRGAVASGAASALRRLGELTGALLATTLHGNAIFHGDPFNLGICGTYSNPVASELIPQADCILVFGAGLNSLTTYMNTLFPKAMIIQIDTDEAAFGRFVDVEMGVQADTRVAAEMLVSELERRGHCADGFRTAAVRDAIAGYRASDGIKDKSTSQLIDPRTLMIEIDRALPPQRIVCVDGGQQARVAIRYIHVERPENFVQASDAGAIGLGIGTAIGAAVGRPGELVVAAIGDASMMMSLGDLETAVRLQLPILVVVSNDEALGSEVNFLTEHGLNSDVAKTPSPSFAAIASAMGARAETIRSPGDLVVVEQWLRERSSVPLVLDCRVNPEIRVHFP
jgi:thiamine pyrophosphate-dependent acetolactate synthase large subunit-like protein